MAVGRKVAEVMAHHKITPRRVFTLSKRKKRLIDHQLRIDETLQDKAREEQHLCFEDLVAYIANNPRKLPCVAEVMSVPRVVPEAIKLGCGDGGSYDIQSGWDFMDVKQQDACLREMERLGVDCVSITPPCDQFSQLQNMNMHKGDHNERTSRLCDAIALLRFAIKVCKWCLKSGRIMLLEHPTGAKSWRVEDMIDILNDPRVISVIGHQCAHGLKIDVDLFLRKASRYISNGRHTVQVLSKRCDGDHEHLSIEGTYNGIKVSRHAQVWTQQMSHSIACAFIN